MIEKKSTFEKNTLVIGSGYWGKNLVRNFSELGALFGICDKNRETLQKFKVQYPGIQIFENLEEALAEEAIEHVAIATPAETHFKMAQTCLLAGKNVFVEKPLALTFAHGLSLVKLSEKVKKNLFVGHLLEYHGAVKKLNEMTENGELGDIQYIYSNRLNLGKFRTEENILWSFAPHDISVILKLLKTMPLEVSCFGGSYLQPNIADTTVTNMLFDKGVRAHIFVSWLHPFKEQKLVVVGSKKMAVFNDVSADQKLLIYDQGVDWIDNRPVPKKQKGTVVPFESSEPLRDECIAFLTTSKEGKLPVTDGYNGLRVLRILRASQHSLQTDGRAVPIYESYEELNTI